MKNTVTFVVPTGKFREITRQSIESNWEPVKELTGWKVIINGQWMQKARSTQQLYASENAAKERTEMEFYHWFRQAFRKANEQLWQDCVAQKDGLSPTDFYRWTTKAFREYMDWCYETYVIEYEEVL